MISSTESRKKNEEEKDAIDLYLERAGKILSQPTYLIPFDDFFDGRISALEEPREEKQLAEVSSVGIVPSLVKEVTEPPPEAPTLIIPQPYSPPPGFKEIVLDKSGLPRQAGAELPEGKFIQRFREQAEKDLFVFAYGVLGHSYFSPNLHKESCIWLQQIPPYRKLLMLPRLHCKSAIVSQCLPLHILIQSKATNVYMPGIDGSDCRILLACETETLGKKWLRVIKSVLMRNQLVRAFWPHIVWEAPKQQSPKWSESEIIVPRETEWPDPTIRAIGVGGAITGARPNILVEDDLVSLEASNSDTVMQTAIDWHVAARALLDEYEEESGLQSLEFCLGTHWSVWDLYTYIEENDPSVEILKRSIYEPGDDGKMKIIWPERWTWQRIEQLKKEFGSLFPLLYMNEPFDPDLVDFNMDMVRGFEMFGELVRFSEERRDSELLEKLTESDAPMSPATLGKVAEARGDRMRGRKLTVDNFRDVFDVRNEYVKAKYS